MRTQIPEDIAADVMYSHDRTCCVCTQQGKSIQIHHIDDDPSNHAIKNLAVLCLQDHDETQIRGGFSRKLRAPEITKFRDEWVRRVAERRQQADELSVERAVPRPPTKAKFRYRPSIQVLGLYLNRLAQILEEPQERVTRAFRDGDSKDGVIALEALVSSIENVLVQLSRWLDPQHFQDQRARDFFSEYVAARNRWNRMLIEPKDYGEKARTGTVETLMLTVRDLNMAVNSIVQTLADAHKIKGFENGIWSYPFPKSPSAT